MEAQTKTAFFHRRNVVPWIFLSPFIILFLAFTVYPLLYALYLSFVKIEVLNSPPIFVGLANYVRLWTDESIWRALRITAAFAVGDLLILITIPLIQSAFSHIGRGTVDMFIMKGSSSVRQRADNGFKPNS